MNRVKKARNKEEVDGALRALTDAASSNQNLLELSVEAARARCTVGEISFALERVFSRYEPKSSVVSGAYKMAYSTKSGEIQSTIDRAEAFAKKHGRRPRILIAKLGQDGHDRGSKVIASSFADLGFDVDIGPLFQVPFKYDLFLNLTLSYLSFVPSFLVPLANALISHARLLQTPEEVARQAIDSDVHLIGISSLAAGHRALVPELVAKLRELSPNHRIGIICGGVIPEADWPELKRHGVLAIFGPGTAIPEAARQVIDLIDAQTNWLLK